VFGYCYFFFFKHRPSGGIKTTRVLDSRCTLTLLFLLWFNAQYEPKSSVSTLSRLRACGPENLSSISEMGGGLSLSHLTQTSTGDVRIAGTIFLGVKGSENDVNP
jgi:hypothetical protein